MENKITLLAFSTFIIFLLISCISNVDTEKTAFVHSCTSENWDVPCHQVVDGGSGKDGIPSIENPNYSSINDIHFLRDEDLVSGIKVGNEIIAHPNIIMFYHEIVNDVINDISITFSYCPLTGSAIAFESLVNGKSTTFGVSGLIHKNNLILYDRLTDSYWSQMISEGINGEHRGTSLATVKVVEMTWKAWKEAFPDSKVLNRNTGFTRDYTKYLYGEDYMTDNKRILFPVHNEDIRLEPKTLVHGIRTFSNAKAYPISGFSESIQVINDNLGQMEIVVAGSSSLHFTASFERKTNDDQLLEFEAVKNSFPIVMKDQENNTWNIFGEAVSGDRKGEKLTPTNGYNAYWFAWADFFPGTEIHLNF
ncbi:DUF3179 domain-containing protein [Rhodohalobacter barkolensis]|uniref:DUF3179 domain-containing protein n=1 Tax=Rhodohalobacter barkolensis TaxID=2053187 RepID=A0A2N0VFZ9_9BACT|nr:DUF3179 domain-containing protein [Rhodohalobacter barkolensis]PKD43090.1 hypothetical protein CWD77_10685 [Rhodohalobacter barkolensis]